MGLQLAGHSRPLPRPIAQDAGHRQLRIVVEDRLRYAAEEAECGVVPVAKRFGGFRRIGLHKAGVAMRQVDCKEVDLALYPGNLRQRLAKVRLRSPGSCRSGTKTSSCRSRRATTSSLTMVIPPA